MFMWHDTQWMWLGMLLFLAFVALFVFYVVKDRSAAEMPRRSATDVLDERYARGEISGEEYSERRETLQHRAS